MDMMQPITLLNTTGHQRIDDIIRGLIGIFEAAFPDRIRAYYLAGSYADRSAVPLSDIDIRVVFKGGFKSEGEVARVRRVRDDCRLLSPVEIDLPPLSEERLLHDESRVHEAIGIKLAGAQLFAAGRLKDIIYPEILPTLKALESTGGETGAAIEEALRVYAAALAESTTMQRQNI
jgi:predicted nucleotidyltransferase